MKMKKVMIAIFFGTLIFFGYHAYQRWNFVVQCISRYIQVENMIVQFVVTGKTVATVKHEGKCLVGEFTVAAPHVLIKPCASSPQ